MTFWEKLERTRFLIAPNTHRPGLCCWIFCFLVPITYIIRAFTTMNGTMVGVHTFYWILGIVQSSMTGLNFKTPDRSGQKTLVEWASKVTRQNYKKNHHFSNDKKYCFFLSIHFLCLIWIYHHRNILYEDWKNQQNLTRNSLSVLMIYEIYIYYIYYKRYSTKKSVNTVDYKPVYLSNKCVCLRTLVVNVRLER